MAERFGIPEARTLGHPGLYEEELHHERRGGEAACRQIGQGHGHDVRAQYQARGSARRARVPVTRTGDYSDVVVLDADGREIPWLETSHIDDGQMRDLMRQVVNRLYTFHLKLDDPRFQNAIDRWMTVAGKWDDPELDQGFVRMVEQGRE